jgi:tRNA threonylcarbamoyladenosine biosynthesis protein TsaE
MIWSFLKWLNFALYIRIKVMRNLLQISYSLLDIHQAAQQFIPYLHQYNIFAFNGDMGAGKTTFISTLCTELGITDSVSSPTFAIINEYRYARHNKQSITGIYHMDWYRIKNHAEAIAAGIEDCLINPNSICLIEWPEKAPELLPKPFVWVNIEVLNETQRVMQLTLIEKHDTLPITLSQT